MKEIHMTEGNYIPYTTTAKFITFDDDVSINLQKREADEDVTIDVCYNIDKELTVGVKSESESYVAQVLIPARKYTTETKDNPAFDSTRDADETTNPMTITEKVAVPFDIESCTVSLFAI
jgi:hypothetical protein